MRRWLVVLALLLVAAAPASFPEGRLAIGLANHLEVPGNLCVAPHSLVDALTMTGEGASGDTRGEFERLLGGLDGSAARDRNRALPVVSANRLWVQKGFPIVPAYARYCKDYFGAEPAALDFVAAPAASAAAINDWVKKATANKIPKLLEANALNADTRLVITNATTLKAKWQTPFPVTSTRPEPFLTEDKPPATVELMSVDGPFRYLEEPDLQVVELPYQEAGLSLIVALPPLGKRKALEARLDEATLRDWLDRLEKVEISTGSEFESDYKIGVSLPKMEIRCDDLSLKPSLQKLGLKLAFGPKSNFSRLSPAGDTLYVDDVIQATMIRFDEQGTEAAAATAVMMSVRSAPRASIRMDHPFLFFLVHRPTSTVLFSGRIVEP